MDDKTEYDGCHQFENSEKPVIIRAFELDSSIRILNEFINKRDKQIAQ